MAAATKARSVKKTAKKRVAKRTTKATPRKTAAMSVKHKSALAEGRQQASAIRTYLDALEAHKPRRGRQISPDMLRSRIEALRTRAASARMADRLQLVQDRLDMEARLEAEEIGFDITALEKAFKRVAKTYAKRKGISYTAFREIGVSAAVLREAGITRSM